MHKYEGMITEYTHEVGQEAARNQELLNAKDDAIAARARELEQALSQIVELNRIDSERAVKFEKLKKETDLLNAQMKEERKEKKAAVKAMDEAENTANECSGAIAELTEENTDLKRRYEVLVAELDRMVEEDYYLPPEAADGSRRGADRKPQKKVDKSRASAARLRPSASTAGGGMRKGRDYSSKASLSSYSSEASFSGSESVASFSSRSNLLNDQGKKKGKRKENTASIIHEKMKKGKQDHRQTQRADGPRNRPKEGHQKRSGSDVDVAARGRDADGHSKGRRSREPLNDSDSDDEKQNGRKKSGGVAEEKTHAHGDGDSRPGGADGRTLLTAANLASVDVGVPAAPAAEPTHVAAVEAEAAAPLPLPLPLSLSRSPSTADDGGDGGGHLPRSSSRKMTKVASKPAFKNPIGRFLEQKLAEDRSAQVRFACVCVASP